MQQAERFQMRLSEGMYRVFLVQADGEPVPVARQEPVFEHRQITRAQTVCDALNNGMLAKIARGIRAERKARA